MEICRVSGCRFANTHVTRAHLCGTCGQFGHGQVECGNVQAISDLGNKQGWQYLPPDQVCDVPHCKSPHTHLRCAHVCTKCKVRGQSCECETWVTVKCPSCNAMASANLQVEVFTASDCIVCFDSKPLVVFAPCKHANVCAVCARRLSLL